jgi:ketosteroid isomerase-like protein
VTLTAKEVETHGTTAIEVGAYKITGPGQQVLDTGKYIVVWKKEDGQWKLHRDIFNTSVAAAPAPAA